jgi:Dolichyl-phosphate-mannose-protein mannosyltransferase
VRLLAREDEGEDEHVEETERQPQAPPSAWRWSVALLCVAAIPRLLYLFVFSDPGNPGLGVYDDVWHHWQIAYLTKEVGLGAPDGPRLWDLKGLEYFWGILHPLLMVAVFAVSGSVDIVLLRLVSLAFGVLTVILIFHICRRIWSTQVGLAASLFAALLPTSAMNDASGMLEPMGVALCLLGIWAWVAGKGWWSGLAFGLAAMSRAEAWIFSLGLVIAANLRRVNLRQRPGLWLGFAGSLGLYMLVLQAKTGNPIYPLWWNFFANALGRWGTPITSAQAGARPALAVVLVIALAGLGLTLRYRPNGHMLLAFGFGYWVFTAGMLGFTSFLSTWRWWMPISRRFEFPYVFIGVLVAVLLLYVVPRRFGKGARPLGWSTVGVALVASQLLWVPIGQAFGPTESAWKTSVAESQQLAHWYRQAPYADHAIAMPPDRPDITYGLAVYGHVEGRHLVSEMYDPFAYLPSGYRYIDHNGDVSATLQCWIQSKDIRLIAIPGDDSNLELAMQLHPEWFVDVGTMSQAGWKVEGVSVPTISCPYPG